MYKVDSNGNRKDVQIVENYQPENFVEGYQEDFDWKQEDKPVYKRWWFLVLLVVILVLVAFGFYRWKKNRQQQSFAFGKRRGFGFRFY